MSDIDRKETGDDDLDSDDDDDDEDDDDEYTGTWDDRCRMISYDMQTKKALADSFAAEKTTELLKKNAKYAQATSKSGKTLLHWAACGGCLLTIQLLLSRGCKKDAKDVFQKTPYEYALASGHKEQILKLLAINLV